MGNINQSTDKECIKPGPSSAGDVCFVHSDPLLYLLDLEKPDGV